MPERIAKTALVYAERSLRPGDKFEVEPPHVHVLLLTGRIEPEEGEPGYVADDMAGGYLTRALTAARPRGRPRKGAAQ